MVADNSLNLIWLFVDSNQILQYLLMFYPAHRSIFCLFDEYNAKLSGFAGWSAAEPRKIRWSAGLAAFFTYFKPLYIKTYLC